MKTLFKAAALTTLLLVAIFGTISVYVNTRPVAAVTETSPVESPIYEWSGTLYQVTETLSVETLVPAPTLSVTATCGGTLKIVAQGASAIACSNADEKSLLIAKIETTAGAVTLNWGNQVYFIPGLDQDQARVLLCNFNAANKRPVGMDGYYKKVLPKGITPIITCQGLVIIITAATP